MKRKNDDVSKSSNSSDKTNHMSNGRYESVNDFTMTQEEMCDSVHWEKEVIPLVVTNAISKKDPILSSSIASKLIMKHPILKKSQLTGLGKRSISTSSTSSNGFKNINEIMNILDSKKHNHNPTNESEITYADSNSYNNLAEQHSDICIALSDYVQPQLVNSSSNQVLDYTANSEVEHDQSNEEHDDLTLTLECCFPNGNIKEPTADDGLDIMTQMLVIPSTTIKESTVDDNPQSNEYNKTQLIPPTVTAVPPTMIVTGVPNHLDGYIPYSNTGTETIRPTPINAPPLDSFYANHENMISHVAHIEVIAANSNKQFNISSSLNINSSHDMLENYTKSTNFSSNSNIINNNSKSNQSMHLISTEKATSQMNGWENNKKGDLHHSTPNGIVGEIIFTEEMLAGIEAIELQAQQQQQQQIDIYSNHYLHIYNGNSNQQYPAQSIQSTTSTNPIHPSSNYQNNFEMGDDLLLSEEFLAQITDIENRAMNPPPLNSNNIINNSSINNSSINNSSINQPVLINNYSHNITNTDMNMDILNNQNSHTTTATTITTIQPSIDNQVFMMDDFILSEEALAQIIALESKALEEEKNKNGNLVVHEHMKTEMNHTAKPTMIYNNSLRNMTLCERFIVIDVVTTTISSEGNKRVKVLTVYSPSHKQDRKTDPNKSINDMISNIPRDEVISIELMEDWFNSNVIKGDVIHVIDIGPSVLVSNPKPTEPPSSSQTPTSTPGTISGGMQDNKGIIGSRNGSEKLKNISKYSIFSDIYKTKKIRITNEWGLLVIQPDILVSPTKISESYSCIRKSVLTDKVRAFGDLSIAAVMGNLKHSFIETLTEKLIKIIQDAKRNREKLTPIRIGELLVKENIQLIIDQCKMKLLEDLYTVGCSDEMIHKDLIVLINPLIEWIWIMYQNGLRHIISTAHLHPTTNPRQQHSTNNNNNNNTTNNRSYLQPVDANSDKLLATDDYFLTNIESSEESLCSLMLGMKGQVDMVAKTMRMYQVSVPTYENGISGCSISHLVDSISLPIELKTGLWKPSTVLGHRAQVMLYVLMLAMRESTGVRLLVDKPTASPLHGLILYISEDETKIDLVKPHWVDICGLVMCRNNLASNIKNMTTTYKTIETMNDTAMVLNEPRLPPLLRSVHECKYCYQATECMIYHAALEGGTADSSGVRDQYAYILQGLTAVHLNYIQLWDQIISLEATATQSSRISWMLSSTSPYDSDNAKDEIYDRLRFASYQTITIDGMEKYLLVLSLDDYIRSRNSCNLASTTTGGGSSRRTENSYLNIGDRVQISVEADKHIIHNHMNYMRNEFKSSSSSVTSSSLVLQPNENTYQHYGGNQLSDIEDLTKSSNKALIGGAVYSQVLHESLEKLVSIEANITTGTIFYTSTTEIHVLLSDNLKRFNELYFNTKDDCNQWYFRLVKDEISTNISTMRSNLLALFAAPYSYKSFVESSNNNNNNINNNNNNNNNNSSMNNNIGGGGGVLSSPNKKGKTMKILYNHRWKELIVDLDKPKFKESSNINITPTVTCTTRPINNNNTTVTNINITPTVTCTTRPSNNNNTVTNIQQDDFLLMKPFHMNFKIYQQALQMLHYCMKNNLDSLHLTSDHMKQLNTIGFITEPYHEILSNLSHKQLIPCITRCNTGQLRVYGGLIVYPGCHPLKLKEEFLSLNIGQQQAIRRILLAEDYALLLGLPGTGKTSTLSIVIRIMIARGQKVLLTSYTHSAVDGLLMKLSEAGLCVDHAMRIGTQSSIHPSIHKYIYDIKQRNKGSISAFKSYCDNIRLVACTVLTASRSHLLKTLSIDCCVMDEAGQIAQPAAFGAIIRARTCILVGDDNQLPPLVISAEAQEKGMGISLFRRFLEAHPDSVCRLSEQYRMNEDIMSLCNHLIYKNELKCPIPAIAKARIFLPNNQQNTIHRYNNSDIIYDWLYHALQPNPAVTFINTDGLYSNLALNPKQPQHQLQHQQQSSTSTNNVSNIFEARIICALLQGLHHSQFDLKNVGIICPFRAQVELLNQMLKSLSMNTTTNCNSNLHNHSTTSTIPIVANYLSDCEVSTVDKYQGRDKEIIILSTVKSIVHGNQDSIGNLLKDWRRINVAITRAKHKLIIIGSVEMMEQVPVLQSLTKFTFEKNWMINLHHHALDKYEF